MKPLYLLIFVLVNSFSVLFGQEVQLGAGIEKNIITTNKFSNADTDYPISAAHLSLSIFPTSSYAFDIRYGGEGGLDYFNGNELSLLLKYYVNDFFVGGGLIYHNVNSNGHGVGGDAISTSLYLPAFTVGVNPNRHIIIEALFLPGLNNKIGYETIGYNSIKTNSGEYLTVPIHSDINLKSVVKINLGYNITL